MVQIQVKDQVQILREEQIQQYTAWLMAESQRTNASVINKVMNEYAAIAAKPVNVKNKRIQPFAPFRQKHSALETFTKAQISITCGILLILLVSAIFIGLKLLVIAIALFTFTYVGNLVLDSFVFFKTAKHSSEEHIDDEIVHALKNVEWPSYTILCPLYHETSVVPQFVKAMKALDYPTNKLQILLLTEEDDTETRSLLNLLPLPAHFHIVTVPEGTPRTKPRACNYGLMQTTGAYVVIYDAEDIPDPLQLKKTVLTFANHEPELACVQAKLNFYNMHQNILTSWFTAEYSTWFDLTLPGLQQVGFSLPLGGTSNHFRAEILRALGGWDVFNVTEDCDLGLRLAHYNLHTVVLNSTTYEEANSQLKNWLRQRSRWIKGYMQTYLVHTRQFFEYVRTGRLRQFLSLQIVVGNKTGLLLLNPIVWTLLIIYILFQSQVVSTYHILFPAPVLYSSAFCLIFGNFFYIYLYLIACMKRKQYSLIKWAVFVPFYWILLSFASFLALFELLVKPHYWQKTVHGLHLKKQTASSYFTTTIAEEPQSTPTKGPVLLAPTALPSIDEVETTFLGVPPSIETSLKNLNTLPMPAVSFLPKSAYQASKGHKSRDFWFIITVILACVCSISATIYFFQNHEILLYGDAFSHLRLARIVIDSATPGFAQLGGQWLPLQHVLMIPFVENDFLWHTGLAGSLVSMPCYIVTAIYLYLSAKRLKIRGSLNFIGLLAFLLNPNILYLQAVPLTEVVCIATFTASCYYFLVWVQTNKAKNLILSAASVFLATLARYDGWSLFLFLLLLIIVVGLMKHKRWAEIEGNIIIFGILGGLGIVLWLIWDKIIFGDALYFQHGQFSSQAQQILYTREGFAFTFHNLWNSIKTYGIDAGANFGFLLSLFVIVAVFIVLWRHRLRPETLAIFAFLTPFVFYIVSLYTGQAIIWVPGSIPPHTPSQFYNVRYGAQLIAPATFFLTILINAVHNAINRNLRFLIKTCFTIIIIAQAIFIIFNGAITVQDGQYGHSCWPPFPIDFYLAQHYDHGKILVDTFNSNFDEAETHIDLKNVIYDGSGPLWHKALQDPASVVDWVIITPDDLVSKHLNVTKASFLQQFEPVVQESGHRTLFHKKGLPPLPTRPLPQILLSEHRLCKSSF